MNTTDSFSAPGPLRLCLLGSYQACIGDQPLLPQHSRKEQWLLALLVLHHDRSLERGWLADLLWPESRNSRALLRDTLSDLRRSLGSYAHRLSSPTPQTLCLHLEPMEADLLRFDAALACGDSSSLEAAVTLYRGPLLEGCTEAWVVAERETHERAYLNAREHLAAEARQVGEFVTASDHLRQVIAVDPLRESAQCALMQTLAAQGEYVAVTQVYRDLRLLLHRELHAEPSEPTQALYRQIQAEARNPPKTTLLQSTQTPGLRVPRLPVPRTRFFGRDEEIAHLLRMLQHDPLFSNAGAHLVTLTGTAGIGKTRLALEVAQRLEASLPESLWFVPLADLNDPDLIADAILNSLRLTRSSQQDALNLVVATLSRQPSLLILDNFEHLVEGGATLITKLLISVPMLTVLVTSRQLLRLEGEQEWIVSPLVTPQGGVATEQLSRNGSVQLFVNRAQAAQPSFRLTEGNGAHIAELCRRLEGIPLAIELAAARSMVLTPEQMLQQLAQRFAFLVNRKRDAPDRHRTLHSAVEWSYRLLSPELQRFFARLSVFRGSWTAEAAEAVCEEPQALDYLAQLRECSFVLAEEGVGEMRFRMLETLREFGEQKVRTDKGVEPTQQKHCAWFLSLAESAERQLTGPEQVSWLAKLELDHDNFRSALAWCGQQGQEAEAGLRMAGALFRFWLVRGYFTEGRSHLTQTLERRERETPTEAHAKALNGIGAFTAMQGDMESAKSLFRKCLAIRKRLGDKILIANTLNNLGLMEQNNDQYDYSAARALYEESLRIYKELGERQGMAYSLSRLGGIASRQNDYGRARTLYTEGLALRRALGDPHGIAMSLSALGNIACDLGAYSEAKTLHTESLEIKRTLGDRWGIAESLKTLGVVARNAGDYATAQTLHRESLTLFQEIADKGCTASALTMLGKVAFCREDRAEALTLYKEGLTLHRELGEKRIVAQSLEAIAEALLSEGQLTKAAQMWGAADHLRECSKSAIVPAERDQYARSIAHMRSLLGEASLNTAWMTGRSLSMEGAIAYALEEESVGAGSPHP